MKVTGIYQQNRPKQNNPSFQMKLVCPENSAARKIFNEKVKDLYLKCNVENKECFFGNKELDVKELFNGLQSTFHELTKGVGGKVKLVESDGELNIEYISKKRKPLIAEYTDSVYELLPNKRYDKGKPFSSAVRGILANVSDMIAKFNRIEYGNKSVANLYNENNEASALFDILC